MQRHRPGLVPDDPVDCDTTPGLEGLDRRFRVRAKNAVDPLRSCSPLTGGAIGEHSLQALNQSTGGSPSQDRHRPAIGQGVPGQRADNAVDKQPGPFLEGFHRRLQLRAEYTVDTDPKIRSPAQRSLQTPNDITRRTGADRRLTWIGHHRLH